MSENKTGASNNQQVHEDLDFCETVRHAFTANTISPVYSLGLAVIVLIAIYCVEKYTPLHFEGKHEIVTSIFSALVSIFNFVGAMLIAQGVILLDEEALQLQAPKKNRFERVVAALFLASKWVRFGTLSIFVAFGLDAVIRINDFIY